MAVWFNIKLLITMGVERKSMRRGGGLRRHSVLAWLRMWRVVQKVERAAAEHLRAYGLNYAQFDVLAHVGAAEGSRQKELGESLLVTKGNVSHLVDQMERRGFISRRQEGRTNRLTSPRRGGDSSRRLYRPTRTSCTSRCLLFRGGASATPRTAASWTAPVAAASTLPTAFCPTSSRAPRISTALVIQGPMIVVTSLAPPRIRSASSWAVTVPLLDQAHVRHPAPGTRCPPQTGSSPSGAASIPKDS